MNGIISPAAQRWIVSWLITGFYLTFVAPIVSSGYHFTGDFVTGFIYAMLLTGIVWVVWRIKLAFFVGTAGVGLVAYFLFLIVGWWLIPAIYLVVLSSLFPGHIHIDTWGSAIWVGLVMMVFTAIVKRALRH